MPLSLPNLPVLRVLSLQRLRQEGSRPFTDDEARLVGDHLGRCLQHDPEHPLIQAAQFDVDTLQLGPYEWLLGWLSPHHVATSNIPDTIANIAIQLLRQHQFTVRRPSQDR